MSCRITLLTGLFVGVGALNRHEHVDARARHHEARHADHRVDAHRDRAARRIDHRDQARARALGQQRRFEHGLARRERPAHHAALELRGIRVGALRQVVERPVDGCELALVYDLPHLDVLAHHGDRLGGGRLADRLLPLLLEPALRRERGAHAQRDGEDQEQEGPAILHGRPRMVDRLDRAYSFRIVDE